ncbi:MAG: hypothetical protein K2I69_09455 [Muribaculaceae bacterium]|nr:hypothetical protein [Muribaculaceae bacterium]
MKKILAYILIFVFGSAHAQIGLPDFPDTLQVELNTKYAIDRELTFTPAVSAGQASVELLKPMVAAINLLSEDGQLVGYSLLYEQHNCTEDDLKRVEQFIGKTPLPEPFSWFIGIENPDIIVFGIKDTSQSFKTKVAEASVTVEPMFDNMAIVHFRLDNGEPTSTTYAFQTFTEQNVTKIIVTEIDGTFLMAPRLNNSITGGAIEVCNLSIPLINKIFRYTHREDSGSEEVIMELSD